MQLSPRLTAAAAALVLAAGALWWVVRRRGARVRRYLPYGRGYLRTLADVEAEAAECTPTYIFSYIQYTAGQGAHARALQAAFDRVVLQPRILRDVSDLRLTVTLFGQEVSPILIAPTGFHKLVHDAGELATAQAAQRTGTLLVYNYMYSAVGAEEIAAACTHRWLQIYLHKDRALALQAVRDAERLGFAAIVLTCDHSHDRVKDYNMAVFANEGDEAFLTARMRFPNSERCLQGRPSESVGETDFALTWKDFEWLTKQTRLPVVCKGVLCADDARLAVQHGAAGIVVSSHGGRQFDAGPLPLAVLQDVLRAVDVPVLYDSGIRSGTHALKALALGAAAVLVGRPVLWGLAAHGREGVEEVVEILTRELRYDMQALGCTRVAALPDHLLPLAAAAAAV